ncbi:MAG: hypothetical protein JSW38_08895 [Dehalococcoidia bacterium]|nr:MAG: hypothetical protein JSV02_05965 [Dehalococcoidia bacterium]UCG82309.1 MAG: hypothetical protein JSW38_08895 [Dehalococcoidia bacterium]
MRRLSWQVMLGLSLVLLSLILYGIHYAVFQDSHHIYIFMLGDIAFVPIEVLLVTLIIHQLLNEREKRIRLEKLNMVIGTFFSSVGTRLLTYLSDADPGLDKIREHLIVSNAWSDQEFADASRSLKNYEYKIDITGVNLEELRSFLKEKQELLVRILENPTLLEHEAFTELLRAVFHLSDELELREELTQLPDSDLNHLANDIKRAYVLLVRQWVDYVKYLKSDYPYLFSLAMRMNPFDMESSPLVR